MALVLLAFAVLAAADAQQPAAVPSAGEAPRAAVYVPERVYSTGVQSFSDFEAMLAALTEVDVVLVGEQHGDPNTHALEAAILQGLARRGVAATLSLEMFERDVQPLVNGYLNGSLSEDEFVTGSRPWPRYASDYRPLVETARANGWPLIASNVPRAYASAVAKGGLGALDTLSPAERAHVAREVDCPFDAYFERFAESMNRHPMPGAGEPSEEARRATTERYYFAQCVKDETMAESIAREAAREGRTRGPIVHYTGAFHSDFGAGTAERVRRRLPGRRIVILTMRPVDDLDAVAPAGEDLKRADYLVYTIKP